MRLAQFQLHADVEQRHWWFVARRRILQQLMQAVVPPGRGHTVIDVGCGTGANLATLADDYRCVGIDTSPDAIALAKRRFPAVQFLCGTAPDDLADELAQARLVLLTDVLEHVPDDFALFSSLLGAVPPGAHFLLTVPADMTLWSQHDESFGHYRRYDEERLRHVWEGLPVSTLLVSHYNARLYPLVKLARMRSRRRGRAAGTAGTDFSLPAAPINGLLTRIFAGESRRLVGALRQPGGTGYRRGVSLVALVRREPGRVETRSKPVRLAADPFTPVGDDSLAPACAG